MSTIDLERQVWIKNIADTLGIDVAGLGECEMLSTIHTVVHRQSRAIHDIATAIGVDPAEIDHIVNRIRTTTNPHKCTFYIDGDLARCVSCPATRPRAP